jgi:2-amino-4-hydroxy-6-hydroxymethyldihydropteridine diphosphokinase
MADGKWQMANGKWQMANGKWQMANGKWPRAEGRGPDSDCVSLTCSGFRTLGEETQTLHWLYWLFLCFGEVKPLIRANPR